MIACHRFVFLHLHKSGGTFINELMLHCTAGARRIGYHLPYAQLPPGLETLPALGAVRNPLAYYVSWYHFQRGLDPSRRNALFNLVSDEVRLDFAATVERLVTLSDDAGLLEALRRQLPDDFVASGLNLTKRCLEPFEGSSSGFYAFLHDRMFGGARDLTVLKTEDLRPGLRSFLQRHCPDEAPLWQAFLDRAPDMNVSRHASVDSCYTPTLEALLRERDAPLFARYGY